jgi:hypothetical protein
MREGREMAKTEPDGVLGTIEMKHAAEVASHDVLVKHIDAEGRAILALWTDLRQRLLELHFDLAEHLRLMSQGRLDFAQAAALLAVGAGLLMFVLLAYAPLALVPLLGFLILASALSIEEFFQAHDERAAFREGIFLALSFLGLLAQFWLGTLRGILLGALAREAVGPATSALGAGPRVLCLALGIFSLVAEVIAGYKLWRARTSLFSATARAARERARCEEKMIALNAAKEGAKAEPEIRRHYRTVGARQELAWSVGAAGRHGDGHLKRALVGALIGLLILAALFVLCGARMSAATLPARTLVQVLDLSKSDSPDDFRANVDAISTFMWQLRAGDRVLILGITDSFGRPAVLFDREMPASTGHLGLDEQAARETISAGWKAAARKINPTYERTDVVGALSMIPDLVDVTAGRTVIAVFSDLQQSTADLDLEHMQTIPVDRLMLRLKQERAIPPLAGASVFLLGVDPVGKSAAYFATLKEFWSRFFREAGADVRMFSVGRRAPAL